MSNREKYLAELQKGICDVVFTKVNGTERKMLCTLNEKLIPEKFETKTIGRASNEENKTALSVFDLEANDWRSFRIDSVIDFKVA